MVWTRGLWISSPALYHCTMVTSGFHLWQFQVFNSGAEGLVVVLFWLDLWQILFLTALGFELGTSGSLVLHSTTFPWQLMVFTSNNFRYLIWCRVFGGVIVLIGPVGDYLFPTLGFELGTSGSLVLHSTTVTWPSGFHLWQFQVFNSGVEGLVVVLFWLDLWDMFFSPTLGFGPGTSGYLILHSNTVPQWFLVFTSDTFRYLTLVQKKWWWYCSDCTCDQFSVSQHQVLKWIPLDL